MKRAILLATMCVVFSAAAQQPITINPTTKPLSPLTTKNVNLDLVRSACFQAVQREATTTKRIRVESVSATAGKTDTVANCVVKAQVFEGLGIVMNTGPFTTTDVQYSVRLDLATGNTTVARIDEDAAKQVALTALASMFIDMKPTALSSDDITFTSTVSGKKCVVEVTTQTSDEPKRWLVKKLDCKH